MGQALSNILTYRSGDPGQDEFQSPTRPSHILIFPQSTSTSTSTSPGPGTQLIQTPLSWSSGSERGGGGAKAERVERWMKHYSSFQKILLVGEGDFSFSASLAVAFGCADNIIATSLDSRGFLKRNYRNAMSNIESLTSRGAEVMHGVDATQMANHFVFDGMIFDRIVFNFPLAGFFPDESRKTQLRRQRKFVSLFMKNAKKMIGKRGEIHVSHKSNGFFREWNLKQLATNEGLRLIESLHFKFTDYPGYHTKYGFGGDKNFNCNPSKTYKFGLKI